MANRKFLVGAIGATCLVLAVASALVRAQQSGGGGAGPPPTATGGKVGGLPAQPFPGWDQTSWDNHRQECAAVGAKFAAYVQMTPAEQEAYPWTPEDRSLNEECMHEVGAASAQEWSNLHAAPPAPGSVPLLKLPLPAVPAQPTPSAGSAAPSGSSASGPPYGVFSSFPGGGGSACATTSQPPDVAADVSPTQNVEFINQGLWVFNKDGSAASSRSPWERTFPSRRPAGHTVRTQATQRIQAQVSPFPAA